MNSEKYNASNLESLYNDLMYLSKDNIKNLSIYMISQIRYFQSIGASYDYMSNYLNNMSFKFENLKLDEEEFLRRDAIKSLKKIYRKEEN